MIYTKALSGKLVQLRAVSLDDCNDNYIKWMNDYETNRFMETRWSMQNRETIIAFVESIRRSQDICLQLSIRSHVSILGI